MKRCYMCDEPIDEKRKFCSLSCAGKYGNSVRKYKTSKIQKRCSYCGDKYYVKSSRKNTSKFCSRDCHDKGKGHYKKEGYSVDWYARNFKRPCVVCGYDTVVHIHHIKEKSKGGTDNPGNLVHLCPNHHAEAHLGIVTDDFLKRNSIKKLLEQEKKNMI